MWVFSCQSTRLHIPGDSKKKRSWLVLRNYTHIAWWDWGNTRISSGCPCQSSNLAPPELECRSLLPKPTSLMRKFSVRTENRNPVPQLPVVWPLYWNRNPSVAQPVVWPLYWNPNPSVAQPIVWPLHWLSYLIRQCCQWRKHSRILAGTDKIWSSVACPNRSEIGCFITTYSPDSRVDWIVRNESVPVLKGAHNLTEMFGTIEGLRILLERLSVRVSTGTRFVLTEMFAVARRCSQESSRILLLLFQDRLLLNPLKFTIMNHPSTGLCTVQLDPEVRIRFPEL
jgi:hypothetical protein